MKQSHKMARQKLSDRIAFAIAVLRNEVYIETHNRRGRCVSIDVTIRKHKAIEQVHSYAGNEPMSKRKAVK